MPSYVVTKFQDHMKLRQDTAHEQQQVSSSLSGQDDDADDGKNIIRRNWVLRRDPSVEPAYEGPGDSLFMPPPLNSAFQLVPYATSYPPAIDGTGGQQGYFATHVQRDAKIRQILRTGEKRELMGTDAISGLVL